MEAENMAKILISTAAVLTTAMKKTVLNSSHAYHPIHWVVLQRCVELLCRSAMTPQFKYRPENTSIFRVQ